MIVGVGVDVVDVDRLDRALRRTRGLAARLFTAEELRRTAPTSLAARFAAKEATAKALGAPPGLRWTDVEVRGVGHGRPVLHVTGTVAAEAARLGVRRWHLSLSHDGGVAVAMVVAES